MNRFILYSVFILNFSTVGQAQELITWDKAVGLAKSHNSEILAESKNLEALQYGETGARSAFFPQLSASLSSTQSHQEEAGGNRGYSAQLSLRQNLFAGFADLNRYAKSKEDTLIATLKLQQKKAEVSARLKQSYANFLYAQNLVKLNDLIRQRRSENMKIVELRFEGGRENRGSVLLARAYYEEASYNYLQAQLLLNTYRAELATFLGLSSELDFVGDDTVPMTEPMSGEPAFEKLAMTTPKYLQAEADYRKGKYDLEIAKGSGFLPSLDVAGGYGRSDEVFFPDKEGWNVGVTLSIPLFSGGKDWAATKSAASQWAAANHKKDATFRSEIVNLRTTFANYKVSSQRLKVDASLRDAQMIRGKIARGKYNNGLMSFEDWDRVENELIQSERAYLDSRRQRVSVEALWEQARGVGAIL